MEPKPRYARPFFRADHGRDGETNGTAGRHSSLAAASAGAQPRAPLGVPPLPQRPFPGLHPHKKSRPRLPDHTPKTHGRSLMPVRGGSGAAESSKGRGRAPPMSTDELPAYTIATVRLYNHLHRRSQKKPIMLSRTLSYYNQSPAAPPQPGQVPLEFKALAYGLKLRRTATTPPVISLFMAVCHALPSRQGHSVLAATLIHFNTDEKVISRQEIRALLRTQQDASVARGHVELLALVWEDHMDLTVFRRKSGEPISTGVRVTRQGVELLLGMVPNQSRCRWAMLPLIQGSHSTAAVAVLTKGYIHLQPSRDLAQNPKYAMIQLSAAGKGGMWPPELLREISLSFFVTQTTGTPSASCVQGNLEARSHPVLFHYMSPEEQRKSQHSEVTEDWSCPLCTMKCSNWAGLGLHMQGMHDLFRYDFRKDGSRNIPEILVQCWPHQVASFNINNCLSFPNSGAVLYRFTANKEFVYQTRTVYQRRQRPVGGGRGSRAVPKGETNPKLDRRPGGLDSACRDQIFRAEEGQAVVVISDTDEDGSEVVVISSSDDEIENDTVPSRDQPRTMSGGSINIQTIQEKNVATADRQKTAEDVIQAHAESRISLSAEQTEARDSDGGVVVGTSTHAEPARPVKKPKKNEDGEERHRKIMAQRTYFHSKNCQVMALEEVLCGYDSDEDWSQAEREELNQRMLETCAANPTKEEQQFMMLWNLYTAEHPIVSDALTGCACEAFAKAHRKRLGKVGLRKHFVMHLVNLASFNLLRPAHIRKLLSIVDGTEPVETEGQEGRGNEAGQLLSQKAATEPPGGAAEKPARRPVGRPRKATAATNGVVPPVRQAKLPANTRGSKALCS